MNKLLLFIVISFFTSNLFGRPTNPTTKQKSIHLESNFIAHQLGLKYDKLIIKLNDNCINYSIGISSIYKRTNFIVPPNVSFPIEINYLRKKRFNYGEVGVTITPQYIFSKDYAHYHPSDLENMINENTNLMYLTPHIGFRYQEANQMSFRINVGPKIRIVKSGNGYINRIFEDNKYLEALYFQLTFGFTF